MSSEIIQLVGYSASSLIIVAAFVLTQIEVVKLRNEVKRLQNELVSIITTNEIIERNEK
jgi:uncharacterized membrane protein (DUF485 family)